VELGLGSLELGGPGLGGVGGGRLREHLLGVGVLSVCGDQHVLDGEIGRLPGLGRGESAAGGLDVADLLGEWALGEGLAADALSREGQLEVVLEDADL
jgi:hypothetical protein